MFSRSFEIILLVNSTVLTRSQYIFDKGNRRFHHPSKTGTIPTDDAMQCRCIASGLFGGIVLAVGQTNSWTITVLFWLRVRHQLG
jgi:hypothetical protein